MIARRFSLVAAVLLALAACTQDFELLTTTVVYDAMTRTLRVERVLHNVSAKFLGCESAETCVAAAEAMVRLDYASDEPEVDFAALMNATEEEREVLAKQMAEQIVSTDEPTWAKLAKGLVDSAAYDVKVAYRREGDALDAVITYSAGVDSKAATDTGVIVETVRKGNKQSSYLVVDAAKSMGGVTSDAAPRMVGVAKFVERTQAGAEPATFWVLPAGVATVTVERFVDETAQPIFAKIPGFDAAMAQAGLL